MPSSHVLFRIEERIRNNKLVRRVALIVVLSIMAILSVPLFLARVKILRITATGRIGHLAIEPDTFAKEQLLGMTKRCRAYIICPPGAAANECLLEYWRPYAGIIRSPFLAVILARAYYFPYICYDVSNYVVAINKTARYLAIQRAWGDRPPLLTLKNEHERDGRARLADFGIPADAEFVCFHCREGGYSPLDEDLHSFRNCNVENYLAAVSELTKNGIWCIRMGDPSMSHFPPMEKVIDYAHHEARSDWMDIFLCASCRFFMGSASGLIYVASVFGKPSGSANHAPLSTVLAFWANDVAIPKLMWSETEERYLAFPEIFASDVANFRFTTLYRDNHVRPIENTADDIRDVALEMLDRSRGLVSYTPEDEELQQRFKALFRPGHFGYEGVNRVGRNFLRKYAHLLNDNRDSP